MHKWYVGQEVYCRYFGCGEVTGILDKNQSYPILAKFHERENREEAFTLEGYYELDSPRVQLYAMPGTAADFQIETGSRVFLEGDLPPPTDCQPPPDMVNHPPHYTGHPSGIECIEITRHMGFNLGNAMKYIWRADLKHDAIEDLKKAAFYINDEIAKREAKNV